MSITKPMPMPIPRILLPAQPPLITGLGVVSPYGMEIGPLFSALLTGDPRRDATGWTDLPGGPFPAHGVFVRGFAPEAWVKPMAIRRLDASSKFALVASAIALSDSGIAAEDRAAMGIVCGTATLGTVPLVNMMGAIFGTGPDSCNPSDFPVTVANSAAGQISILHGLKGPNLTISQKENSGLAALGAAAFLLESGLCERVLVVAADDYPKELAALQLRLGVLAHGVFSQDEKRAQGPFSEGANGILGGEGAYALVLESRAAAARRGAKPLAQLRACGDVHLNGAQHRWPENGAAYAELLSSLAEIAPVEAIVAAANGSPFDRVEADAIAATQASVSSWRERPPAVTGWKFATGESGAASLASAVLAIAALNAGTLPPIAATRAVAADLPALDFVLGTPRPLSGGAILVGAISHGGAACAALLEKAPADAACVPF